LPPIREGFDFLAASGLLPLALKDPDGWYALNAGAPAALIEVGNNVASTLQTVDQLADVAAATHVTAVRTEKAVVATRGTAVATHDTAVRNENAIDQLSKQLKQQSKEIVGFRSKFV
jgi:hypothetical protein